MKETRPYSAVDNTVGFVYNGTKIKVNIRGNTVAKP